MHEPPQADHDERKQRERKREQRLVGLQGDGGEPDIGRQPPQVEQAVLAAGHAVPFDRDEPDDLPECDGEQRVVDPAPMRHERGDDRSQQRGRQ